MFRSSYLTAASLLISTASSAGVPHVVFILADDYGWNDVGYHQNAVSSANPSGNTTTNGYIPTPNIDKLCGEGVKLENYYVQPLCSPTRGTVMTGRYASHTGIGPAVINEEAPYGMPGSEVFLPELLKDAGYSTHMVGKWHLGFCDERYTPTFRGFDSYLGYLIGAEQYYNHSRQYGSFALALDFRNGTGPTLAPILADQLGNYSANVFADEAVRLIEAHAEKKDTTPFFLYLPFQSVHVPLQAPQDAIDHFEPIIPHTTGAGKQRQVKAGMIKVFDEGVGNITAALERVGMVDDTVIIFSTDNGGRVGDAGNNYPLRGQKATNWEGGVRGVSCVKGTNSNLAPLPKGTTSMELMHTTDWLPTIVRGLGGGNTDRCKPLDGFNQWAAIQGTAASNRTIIAHNVPAAGKPHSGAMRIGRHKILFEGMQTANETQHPPPEMESRPTDQIPKPVKIDGVDVYIFDVLSDPTETFNLASNTTLYNMLVKVFDDYQNSAVPDLSGSFKSDPTSNPALRPDKAWGPFVNSTQCKFEK
eukprot:TRINITY_DN12063_c0_g1_i1.p1 TRINITY_DN12063_c0_g1~~TRINITY_DN12063_c0_g1_i1.p1  ORF type:complete len:531 (+),score=77.68 TRINITY_DN12063_c0_g1_i1:49-1641(+)